jgi:hypothetical protein
MKSAGFTAARKRAESLAYPTSSSPGRRVAGATPPGRSRASRVGGRKCGLRRFHIHHKTIRIDSKNNTRTRAAYERKII